jgi:hypothetical protein
MLHQPNQRMTVDLSGLVVHGVAFSQHRVVGRVLQIDREGGLVKLATDEGVVVVQTPPQTLRVIRVGEIVSVPRSAGESPSASPRQ